MEFLKRLKINKSTGLLVVESKNYFFRIFSCFAIIILFFTFDILKVEALTINKSLFSAYSLGLNSGLVGYWTFDGNNLINNVTDSSGNGNTGILVSFPATSSAIVQGKVGQALKFNSSDYVTINDSTSLRTTVLTISFWLNFQSQNLEYLLFKDKASNVSYYMQNNNSSNLKFCTTGDTCISMSNAGMQNNWTYITVTFDGSTAKFYKNGIYVGQQGSMNAIDYTSPNKLYIGYSSNSPQAMYDDLRIYNRVLSDKEILQLYNSSNSKVAVSASKPSGSSLINGLVGHWTFDGKNLINNVTDSSGAGHSGYLVNFPATSSAVVGGKIGQALKFDGDNDYIDVGGSDWLGTGDLTISAWVYPKSRGENGNGSILDNRKVIFGMYDTACASCIVFSSDGQSNYAKSANGSVPFNQWSYVTATRNSSGVANVYVNGVLSGSANQNSGTPAAGGFGVQIGNTLFASRTWDGYIDDLRVYNRILSTNEISQLYNSSNSKVAVPASKPSGSSLINGLVGHWTFDGKNLINNVTDSSGNGNTGYLKNMSTTSAVTAGKIGQALNFDGVDDYIRVSPSSTLNDLGPLTYSAWVYQNAAPGSENDIVVKRRRLFALTNLISPSTLYFITSNDSVNTSVRSNASIPLNKWIHVAVVWNGQVGANLSYDFYVNGVVTGKTTFNTGSNSVLSDVPNDLTIGAFTDGSGGFVNGKIDDVRVYNRVLSANEIYQLYNMGR